MFFTRYEKKAEIIVDKLFEKQLSDKDMVKLWDDRYQPLLIKAIAAKLTEKKHGTNIDPQVSMNFENGDNDCCWGTVTFKDKFSFLSAYKDDFTKSHEESMAMHILVAVKEKIMLEKSVNLNSIKTAYALSDILTGAKGFRAFMPAYLRGYMPVYKFIFRKDKVERRREYRVESMKDFMEMLQIEDPQAAEQIEKFELHMNPVPICFLYQKFNDYNGHPFKGDAHHIHPDKRMVRTWTNSNPKENEIILGTSWRAQNCPDVMRLVVPDNIIGIGKKAFEESSLREIKLSNSCVYIGESAFRYSALEDIQFSPSVKSIGAEAFKGTEITRLNLPPHVTLGVDAFSSCKLLKETNIPAKAGSYGAFAKCTSLEKVTFEEGCKTVRKELFWGCNSLKEVIIPDSVTSIKMSDSYHHPDWQVKVCEKWFPGYVFSYANVLDFIRNPSVETLNQIKEFNDYELVKDDFKSLTDAKIILAGMFVEDHKDLLPFLKANKRRLMYHALEEDNIVLLDIAADNNFIDAKFIDKYINTAIEQERHEAYIYLTQFKHSLGKTDKEQENRFEL